MDKGIRAKVLSFISHPLSIGIFFSLYIFFIRFLIYPRYQYLFFADSVLIQNFIEWFGVAYGLLIALVLVNVWGQFDTIEREFDREADAISMLYQSAKQIKDTKTTRGLQDRILEEIKKYVLHVIAFFREEHKKPIKKETGDKILENLRDAIGELVHTRERDSLTSEMVKRLSEAVDLRGDRISHSKQHMPTTIWAIALVASILWLIPFNFLSFQNDVVAIILVGGVTVIVVAILIIIKDLDEAFEGTWKIETDDWELLREKFDQKPTLLFVYDLDSSPFSIVWAFINNNLSSGRVCALFALLSRNKQRDLFFEPLAESAYSKIFYKDQFEELYDESESLPVVIYKSISKREVIVHAAEIKGTTTLTDLGNLIQERLTAFHPHNVPAIRQR